jgi:hypothetical protein
LTACRTVRIIETAKLRGDEGTVDHIPEDDLDRYGAGSVSAEETAPIEEHLLFCEVCQDRLQLTDEFIAALRDIAYGPITRRRVGRAQR